MHDDEKSAATATKWVWRSVWANLWFYLVLIILMGGWLLLSVPSLFDLFEPIMAKGWLAFLGKLSAPPPLGLRTAFGVAVVACAGMLMYLNTLACAACVVGTAIGCPVIGGIKSTFSCSSIHAANRSALKSARRMLASDASGPMAGFICNCN